MDPNQHQQQYTNDWTPDDDEAFHRLSANNAVTRSHRHWGNESPSSSSSSVVDSAVDYSSAFHCSYGSFERVATVHGGGGLESRPNKEIGHRVLFNRTPDHWNRENETLGDFDGTITDMVVNETSAIVRANPLRLDLSRGFDNSGTIRIGMKRGPEELLSPLTNGASAMSPQPTNTSSSMVVHQLDNDAKKAKLDQSDVITLAAAAAAAQAAVASNGGGGGSVISNNNCMNSTSSLGVGGVSTSSSSSSCVAPTGSAASKISRVVHIRNLPADLTDVELIHLCIPFGKITNRLMLKKNQALVEYETVANSAALVARSQTCPIVVRGLTMYCDFSNHQELKTNGSNGKSSNGSSSMLTVDPANPSANLLSSVNTLTNGGDQGSVGGSTTVLATQQQPNSVLRIIIENMLYPVTLDILHQIFSRFGKALRIITFTKNNTFQALVQFSDSTSAQLAKTALDGQNVYNGCCTLRIDYSKLSTLNVKYNNDKSRDYTNPNLPSGELALEQQLGLSPGVLSSPSGLTNAFQNPFAAAASAMPSGAATFGATSYQAFSHSALQAAAAANAAAAAGGLTFPQALQLASATNNALAGVAGLRLPTPLSAALASSPVILVSNLSEEKVTPDALFTLFGLYGDVQRVKILFNKKDNALVQYAEPPQAQLAMQHLDKMKLWGKQIRVAGSKHRNVQMPKEGQPDAGLTKDYSQSPLHRFKKPGSKNYLNIYPPSSTLHLSNIPPNVTEEFLIAAFTAAGFAPKSFKFFAKDHKMALMQLTGVEEAIQALLVMHNFKLADNAHLRVSFSRPGV